MIAKPAAQLGDLRGLLSQYKPQIVHFSGHGSRHGELMFVNGEGKSQSASIEALADLFRLFNSHVRCVVLNACYSDEQASAIAEQIDCVLGFEGAIADEAARVFSVGFYGALAAGESVAVAREHGLNEIKLRYPEYLQPCLDAGRADAANLRPVDWDKPIYSELDAQFWKELTRLVVELYPRGPEEQQIWVRTGGDVSLLSLNLSGKALWISAIELLKKGGGGKSIDLVSLINGIEEDFPKNPGIIKLKGSLNLGK